MFDTTTLLRVGNWLTGLRTAQILKFQKILKHTWLNHSKESTLERGAFALKLLMFETAEKEREMFIVFFLCSFYRLLSPWF